MKFKVLKYYHSVDKYCEAFMNNEGGRGAGKKLNRSWKHHFPPSPPSPKQHTHTRERKAFTIKASLIGTDGGHKG